MVAGQNEQGKEEAFTREAINPVMALTGASLGTEDTSPRPNLVMGVHSGEGLGDMKAPWFACYSDSEPGQNGHWLPVPFLPG